MGLRLGKRSLSLSISSENLSRSHAHNRYIEDLMDLMASLDSQTEETFATLVEQDFQEALKIKQIQLKGIRQYLSQNKSMPNSNILQQLLDQVEPKCKTVLRKLESREKLRSSRRSSRSEDVPANSLDSGFGSFKTERGNSPRFRLGSETESLAEESFESSNASFAEDASGAMTGLTDLLNCGICTDTFQDPRILPCGHTFCSNCLEDLIAYTLAIANVPCPTCRKKVPIPEGGVAKIAKNVVVAQLMDRFKVKRSTIEVVVPEVKCKSTSVEPPPIFDREMSLLKTIELAPGSRVIGVTLINRSIYVITEHSNFIDIYDKDTFMKSKSMFNSLLRWPKDITSTFGFLYIIDDYKSNNCVWKVELSGKRAVQFIKDLSDPYTLSTTKEGHLLLLRPSNVSNKSNLEIYGAKDAETKPIRSITLPTEIMWPKHAVQLHDGDFIICYGTGRTKEDGCWSVWTISRVSFDGEILHTLPPGILSGPFYYLAVNHEDEIFVSEAKTKQVYCFDSQLRKIEKLVNTTSSSVWEPWKLCFSKENRLLIVGHAGNTMNIFR